MNQFLNLLHRPTSIATMVYFRICFGLFMLWEVFRFFNNGWISKFYIKPEFNFTYSGFHWVKPLSDTGMYLVFFLLGILAVYITIGLFYRISIILFTITFSYIFLLEKTLYLNHFYLVILISVALCLSSPHLSCSVDSFKKRVPKSYFIPQWQPWLICFLMVVVYFYGGLAKINFDWINGNPLYFWTKRHGGIFTYYHVGLLMSWAGLILDLFIPFLLIMKRFRVLATFILIFFHVLNAMVFNIGIFPWISLALVAMFYPSDWPIRFLKKMNFKVSIAKHSKSIFKISKPVVITLSVFVLYNLLMPLRHHFAPGNVIWNEMGHRFSWRMKLRSKRGKGLTYNVTGLTSGRSWLVNPAEDLHARQVRKIGGHPEMIVEYAHYLNDRFKKSHPKENGFKIRASALVSVNYRPYKKLIDPNYDLTTVKDCGFCKRNHITKFNNGSPRSFSSSEKLMDAYK